MKHRHTMNKKTGYVSKLITACSVSLALISYMYSVGFNIEFYFLVYVIQNAFKCLFVSDLATTGTEKI